MFSDRAISNTVKYDFTEGCKLNELEKFLDMSQFENMREFVIAITYTLYCSDSRIIFKIFKV